MRGFVMVPARDLCWKEATEGFVDRGGEGSVWICGVLTGVVEPENVSASFCTAGDCKGDWTGLCFREKSIIRGGRSGVVACPWSCVSSDSGLSILIGAEPRSLRLSSKAALTGEGGR